jgi:hypothetical protein
MIRYKELSSSYFPFDTAPVYFIIQAYQSEGIVVTIFSLLRYLDEYIVRVNRSTANIEQIATSNNESTKFSPPRIRLKIEGYMNGININTII